VFVHGDVAFFAQETCLVVCQLTELNGINTAVNELQTSSTTVFGLLL